MSPLQDWLGDGAGREAALELVHSLAPILGEVFGEAVTDPDEVDPNVNSYFSAMPIRDLLEFAAPAGGPEPEARLEGLMGSLGTATSAEPTGSPALTATRNG
jgi:hypothetical protein